MKTRWCKCPKCGYEHFIKIRLDTKIIRFPAYCKRCKEESIITIEPRAERLIQ